MFPVETTLHSSLFERMFQEDVSSVSKVCLARRGSAIVLRNRASKLLSVVSAWMQYELKDFAVSFFAVWFGYTIGCFSFGMC